MRTYTANTNAKGGYYFNIDEWNMLVVPEEGQVLPGEPGERYIKLPTLALFVAAPLIGAAFAMFLPFIGLALVGKFAIDKAGHAIKVAAMGIERMGVPETVEGPKAPKAPAVRDDQNHGGLKPGDPEC